MVLMIKFQLPIEKQFTIETLNFQVHSCEMTCFLCEIAFFLSKAGVLNAII